MNQSDRIALNHGSVDLPRRRFHRGTEVVRLTTKEAQLLAYLAARPHQDVSREQLLTEVWGYRCVGTTRAVDHTVRRLRAKVEAQPDEPAHIMTVYGHGYRFEPPASATVALTSANTEPADAPREIESILAQVEVLLARAHALASTLGDREVAQVRELRALGSR